MPDFVTFAREADDRARAVERRILPDIEKALSLPDPVQRIYEVLRPEFERTYETPGLSEFVSVKRTAAGGWKWFRDTIDDALRRLKPATASHAEQRRQAERLSSWLGVATVNGALVAAGQTETGKRWTSQHDDRVRHFHVEADGQTVLMGEKFTVCDGRKLSYPGEPIGDPDCWIRCRCFVVPVSQEAAAMSTTTNNPSNLTWVNPGTTTITYDPRPTFTLKAPPEEEIEEFVQDTIEEPDMADLDVESAIGDTLTPWHAVFAPEGVASGDGRRFAQDALSWRDLPLPLKWQKVDAEGHGGSVIVGRIDNMFREGNLILGDGVFLATEEADELIGMIAEKAVRGISVDVDSAELSVAEDEDFTGTEFAKGRISSATVVSIPAFSEAYIALGERPQDDGEFRNVSTEERKRLTDRGAAMPGGEYPIANCEDLHNAVQAIGRAKDPAAVKRHIKKRAGALNCPGFELPEGWAVDTEDFGPVPRGPGDKRGPGWVTAPKATRRIHHYWTRGEGAAKIRWGAPGDFNRCRMQLAKYIKPPYLNRTCAEWHMDALGYWPATHAKMDRGGKRGKHASETVEANDCGCDSSVNLVAAATTAYPVEMFSNPGFDSYQALDVYEFYDGLYGVRGHLAAWGTCHIGIKGVCTEAPKSLTDYRMFRTGLVRLANGGSVPVGQITMNCGHAALSDRPHVAAAHYDNTGTAVADVTCGEDDHGIWVAGAIRPDVTEEQRTILQASALSGDWRSVGGNLELVAALCVNTPGFPVPRIGLAASGGEQTALVAAGIVCEGCADNKPTPPSDDDLTVEQARKIIQDLRSSRAARIMEDVRHERIKALSDI